MFRKIVTVAAFLAAVAASSAVMAQSCPNSWFSDQRVESASDLSKNNRSWNISCCPEGYRVHGLACSDIVGGKDDGDGCSAVCRSITKGDIMQPHNDFQRAPGIYRCEPSEVFVGVACKDNDDHGGGVNSDVADSCTAICEKTNGSTRYVENNDLHNTGRSWNVVQIPLGSRRVSGVACKDLQNGSSDRLDGCTIISGNQKMK